MSSSSTTRCKTRNWAIEAVIEKEPRKSSLRSMQIEAMPASAPTSRVKRTRSCSKSRNWSACARGRNVGLASRHAASASGYKTTDNASESQVEEGGEWCSENCGGRACSSDSMRKATTMEPPRRAIDAQWMGGKVVCRSASLSERSSSSSLM